MAGRDRRFTVAAIALLSLLMVAMPGLVRAATLTVTNTHDTGGGSLRSEILAASSGDTINFSVSGTITLGSSLPAITINLTIDGSGQAITVDGAHMFQILIVNAGASLTLENLTIANGSAGGGSGGGIFNSGGTLTVTNSTFTGSSAGDGGAINNNHGSAMITNSTFSGNSAVSGVGGGIANFSELTVTNSTFTANSAHAGGGGIDNFGAIATMTVTNSTFSANSVGAGGGAGGVENHFGATTTLKGTILAAESSGNCGAFGGGPLVTDAGYNISDDNTCGFTMAPSGTSINNSTTLHLDPAGLEKNGGPTETIALEPDSEAVDFIPVASCTDQSSPTPLPLTTDQRGLPRPDFGNPRFCDAGAFELQTTPIVVEANGDRLQIARSTTPNSDKLNLAFTFIENGFPACDAADDAFNGFNVYLATGSCASLNFGGPVLFLDGWVVHTVNHQSYGTLFFDEGGGTLSARMVELPTPAAPACGEWTVNLELAGFDSAFLGNGPFALGLRNPDGDTGCFEITNAIVGSQIPTPGHGVRRRVRR
jgi:hypothetical protein